MSLALIEAEPSRQNTYVAVGDPLPLRLKHRIGKRDQLCPGHRPQDFFKIVPAHLAVRIKVSMQLPRRPGGNSTQLLQDSIARDPLCVRRRPESLRDTIDRCAKV